MDYLVLCVLVILNSSQFIFSSLYNRRQKNADPYLCTLIIAVMVFLFYGVYSGFKFTFSTTTIIFGLLFGVAYCFGYIFQIRAIAVGSVSLTSLMLSYSLIIPILFGIIYYHDSVSVFFFIALILLVIALCFVNYDKEDKQKDISTRKNKKLWLFFALLAFLGNAMCVIFNTLHQKSEFSAQRFEFMTFAMCLVVIVNLTLTLINNAKNKTTLPSLKKGWWCAVILGLLNAGTNLCYMIIAANNAIPVSLLNSFISVGSLLLTFILSRVIFKEKLKKLQLIGFFIGLISVLFFSI